MQGKIISLSEASSIAIHAVVIIASEDKPITVNRIAEVTGASKNHLSKVMQFLVKHNIVNSIRGPLGGFVLNKTAYNLTLLDIYECMEGKIIYNEICPLNRPVCPFQKCIMGNIVNNLTKELKESLSLQTLGSFIKSPHQ